MLMLVSMLASADLEATDKVANAVVPSCCEATLIPGAPEVPKTSRSSLGLVVPMPTFPLEFQIPEPGKYALLAMVKLVVDAPPLMVKRPLVMVEEASERKPLVKVARPVWVRAPVRVVAPLTVKLLPNVAAPLGLMVRAATDEVAVAVDVAIYKVFAIERKVQALLDAVVSTSANCGPVEEATVSAQ